MKVWRGISSLIRLFGRAHKCFHSGPSSDMVTPTLGVAPMGRPWSGSPAGPHSWLSHTRAPPASQEGVEAVGSDWFCVVLGGRSLSLCMGISVLGVCLWGEVAPASERGFVSLSL